MNPVGARRVSAAVLSAAVALAATAAAGAAPPSADVWLTLRLDRRRTPA